MKLTQFRDLLAVVQTGSLRSASRHLGIAQPVITRSIRDLENELGRPLFQRHSKGMSLTPAGETFVRRIKSIQSEINRAKDEVAQLNGEFVGEVSIGLSPLCAVMLLPPAIATFNREFPKAVVKITESLFQPISNNLAEGLLDFWVGPMFLQNVSQRFAVEQLMPHGRRIAARVDHPLQSARRLEELADASWVRPALAESYAESDLEALFEDLGLAPPMVTAQSSSIQVMLATAAASDLLAIVPKQIFRLMPVTHLCAPLPHIPPLLADPICLVTRQGLPLTPLAEKLSDLMRKSAHNQAILDAAQ